MKHFKIYLSTCTITIMAYLVCTVYFYIDFLINPVLTLLEAKPLFMYIIKWIYAIIMLKGALNLNAANTNPNRNWIFLNISSVGVLLLVGEVSIFYSSVIDVFLLEIVSLSILIISNIKIQKKLWD